MKKMIAVALAASMTIGMTSFMGVSAATPASASGSETTGTSASDFVTTNGNYFMLDGKPFYYEGTNNYYMNYAPDYMIDDVLSGVSKMGLKVLRCWGFLDGKESAGCVMQSSLGVYDESGFERLDYTISEASKLGIKLILPMVNNWDDFGGMDQYVTWAGASKHDDFYTNETCKTGYKNYVKYLLNHVNTYTGIAYKDDPTIMAWELANEPRCQTDATGDTLTNWVTEMSAYVKSIDSNHLLTVGDEGFFNRGGSDFCYNGGSGVDWDRLISLPNIDFETMHLYPDGWGKTIDWSVQYINDHIDKAKEVGKPVIMEEYGTTSNKIENYTKFNDALYKSSELGEGAAGSMFWLLTGIGWDDSQLYQDYDGFRVTYPSDVASLITSYESKMEEKNETIPGNNSSIDPTSSSFDLYKPADVAVTMTLNGNTLSGIYNGTDELSQGTDYTVSDNTVTISKDYLSKQEEGTLSLKFAFSAGVSRTLTIDVTDSTPVTSAQITPTTASFDKNPANESNISVDVTYNGQTLKGIYNGSKALTEGTDYTVSDNTVTISKNYLSKQSVGTTDLKFDFSKGTDPVLSITISDSTPVPKGTLKVEMFNGNTASSTNGIQPRFRITNTGSTAIDLSQVKLRYYFTEDGTQDENFWCDWSSAGSSNVTGSFVKTDNAADGADTYLEIGFTSAAGTLAAGQSIEIQARFAKADWSNYDQTNDFSFDSSDTGYVSWTKSTAYINGELQWGAEP